MIAGVQKDQSGLKAASARHLRRERRIFGNPEDCDGSVPGGAVLGRRLNGDHSLAAVFGRVLQVDEAFSAALLAQDRSFFYREVVVAHAPREASTGGRT